MIVGGRGLVYISFITSLPPRVVLLLLRRELRIYSLLLRTADCGRRQQQQFFDECWDGLLVHLTLLITMLLPLCVDLLPIIGSGWAV